MEIQAKLLRLLQENQYSQLGSGKTLQSKCRFIFATNRDIPKLIKDGTFRKDLYYRINVFQIEIPSLKERKEDIPDLLYYFINKYGLEFNLTIKDVERDVLKLLSEYSWPGNIRELENVVIRSFAALSVDDTRVNKELLKLEDIPVQLSSMIQKNNPITEIPQFHKITVSGKLEELLSDYSRLIISEAIKSASGNKSKAAEILGINRATLYYKLKELNIE